MAAQDRQSAGRAAQIGAPGRKKALAEIDNAEDREHAEAAAKAFADVYGAKWPKVAAKITEDLDVLLAFYDCPAEHKKGPASHRQTDPQVLTIAPYWCQEVAAFWPLCNQLAASAARTKRRAAPNPSEGGAVSRAWLEVPQLVFH